jgi:hypothetical protein
MAIHTGEKPTIALLIEIELNRLARSVQDSSIVVVKNYAELDCSGTGFRPCLA